jgi:serine/threonine-protein kinase
MPVGESPPAAALADKVAQSAAFSRSKRHAALLNFLASQPVGAEIKETLIGHEFFGRPAGYDPKLDPVVRVEMRRLRDRLQTYYDAEGLSDPWRLDIPKGAYALILCPAPTDSVPPPKPEAPPLRPPSKRVVIAACLVALLLAVAIAGWRVAQPHQIASIAVLPLSVTVSGDGATAATGGLSREIASELSRIVGLRVVGPEAAARAQFLTRDLPEIARHLDVDAILTGDAHADSGRLQLQVQLSSGKDQTIIWTRTLERDLVDPFALQNELAASVAAAIHRDLLRAPAAQRPVAREALFQYQQARLLLDRRSSPAIHQAIDGFRSATKSDPLFANAWAALADALAVFPDYGSPAPGWVDEARAAARKAFELDPDNADAYAALGWIEFASDLRAAAATRLLSKAVSLNPNHVLAQRRLAMVLLAQRRFRESEQRLRTAQRLDALSPMVRINLAELFYYQSDFAREEPELRAILQLNPNFVLARVMLANMLSRVNRCGEAVPVARRLIEESDGAAWRASMAGVLARCGDLSLARQTYRPEAPAAMREEVAEFFDDRPLELQFMERIVREQPDYARSFSIGPDGPKYARYPPIRALFDTLDRRIAQPE